MTGCKYQKYFKCESCKFTIHRGCKNFVIAHAKELAVDLQPFVYSTRYKPKGKYMWSKDANRAKSLALQCALQFNLKLKKYTLSQIISVALAGETLADCVAYIECTSKMNGDVEKIKGVVTSFIESSVLNNARFVVYVAPTNPLSFEFSKI